MRHQPPHHGVCIAIGLRDLRRVAAAKDNKNLQRVDTKALAGAPRRFSERRKCRGDEILFLFFCELGKTAFFLFRALFFLFFCFCRLLRRFLFFLCRQQFEAERADREPQVQLLSEPQQRAHAEKSDQKKDQQDDPNHF